MRMESEKKRNIRNNFCFFIHVSLWTLFDNYDLGKITENKKVWNNEGNVPLKKYIFK